MLALLFGLLQAATITLKANQEPSVDGPLYSNTAINIDYDFARATCPHSFTHGMDTWVVSLCYSINGQVQQEKVIGIPDGQLQYKDEPIINVPQGDLAIWFRCSSASKTTYDSNYGKNFNFKVINVPSLVFKADFTHEVKGTLVPGGSVAIDYDSARAKCSSAVMKYGFDTKNVAVSYSFNGKQPKEGIVLYNRAKQIYTIQKLEKGEMSLWFRCTSMLDTVYDSNFSKNYIFTIQ
jgi:hypothetical protein